MHALRPPRRARVPTLGHVQPVQRPRSRAAVVELMGVVYNAWGQPIGSTKDIAGDVEIRNGVVYVRDAAKVTLGVDTLTCRFCRRRRRYVECSKCRAPLCALCSWTASAPRADRNGIVDERCRACADL